MRQPSQTTRTRAAVTICRTAWERAYSEEMEASDNPYTAAKIASKAWCCAMPMLSTHETICDFIACVAQGILLEAIPENMGTKLLYAAQVARTNLPTQPKAKKRLSA